MHTHAHGYTETQAHTHEHEHGQAHYESHPSHGPNSGPTHGADAVSAPQEEHYHESQPLLDGQAHKDLDSVREDHLAVMQTL